MYVIYYLIYIYIIVYIYEYIIYKYIFNLSLVAYHEYLSTFELQVAAIAQELDFFLSALPDHDDTWHKKCEQTNDLK